MIFVDTGYLIALARPRDALYTRALAWSAAITEPKVTTEYVLLEVLNFLSAVVDRQKGHTIVDSFNSAPDCEIVPASCSLWSAGKALHARRRDKEWSMTDSLSFVVMDERGITRALTHDHDFEQAGYVALLRHDP